jgi:hypothetical protein
VILIKILFISLLLLLTLNARENPFLPSVGEVDIPMTSNEDRTKTPLKRATITLPAQARLLQKVTIEYKNLDGSVENKSIELDNYVDWHLPIFISQSYTDQSETTHAVVSAVSSTPAVIADKKKVQKDMKYENIASINFLKLYSSGKNLKLVTGDNMIRNFLLVNPHRIVIDFKRDTDLKSYTKKIPKNIFCEVRIGNHSGYYRVVVELDGLYRYEIKKISDGYILELR